MLLGCAPGLSRHSAWLDFGVQGCTTRSIPSFAQDNHRRANPENVILLEIGPKAKTRIDFALRKCSSVSGRLPDDAQEKAGSSYDRDGRETRIEGFTTA
jgi:hypothetical protein